MFGGEPSALFFALFIAAHQAPYRQEQPAYKGEYKEHYQESGYSVCQILRIHAPCTRIPLSDLNSERDHQHQREYIQEGDDHLVIVFCQKLEQRIEDEDAQHPQRSYNYEMKLLVVEVPSSLVIDAEYMIMHLSDPVDSSVYPFSHFGKKPSFLFPEGPYVRAVSPI